MKDNTCKANKMIFSKYANYYSWQIGALLFSFLLYFFFLQ